MIKKIAIFIFSICISVQASACLELLGEFRQTWNAEKKTLRNVINYLNTNTKGWRNAHSLVQSGRLKRRNYNGNMSRNGSRSSRNAQALRDHIGQINRMMDRFGPRLEECLIKAQQFDDLPKAADSQDSDSN